MLKKSTVELKLARLAVPVLLLGGLAFLGCPSIPTLVFVPNLIGMQQASAEEAVVSAGLSMGSVATQINATVPAGQVLQQYPPAGSPVPVGTLVALSVAISPTTVSVPNVLGMNQAVAQNAIVSAGLTVGTVTTQISSTIPAGQVLQQSPSAGSAVAAGTPVALVIATGPPTVSVPNVVGMNQAVAENAIVNAGLTVGSVTTQISSTVPAGQVLQQSPSSGLLVTAGTGVNLVISIRSDYDLGFEAGYAEDEWYEEGYLDSWEAAGFASFYEGDEIPSPQSPEYERGYWDGVWYAYNDGYFQAYDDAFVEGFLDGYDDAHFAGWELFLLSDEHVEYGTGNFDDGYNDGYSEGVVFGAYDFDQGIGYDPEGALADYRDGVDVCVPVGAGEICTGEIPLYEYGTNPVLKSAVKRLEREDAPAIRKPDAAAIAKSKRG